MKNRLPKYWVVENDDSQRFKDTVLKYLNETYNCSWSGNFNVFYGFDGSCGYGGTGCWDEIESFKNNPALLTIDEFVELSKPIQELSREQVKEIAEKAIEWYCNKPILETGVLPYESVKYDNFLDHYFKEKEEQTLDGKTAIIDGKEYELKLKR